MRVDPFVVNRRGREAKSLLEVFFLEVRVFSEEGRAIRVGRQQLEHATNRDPHASDAGFPPAFAGFDRDAVKWSSSAHES